MIVRELSHAVQDVDVLELYNEKYNNDKPYRTLVERDADSRTLSILEQNDEFIKEEFGINVVEWYGIECNEFFEITNDIDEIRFISLTIDYCLAHKCDSNNDMHQSRIISRFIRDALSSNDCYMIDLTLNDTIIILKQIVENLTD